MLPAAGQVLLPTVSPNISADRDKQCPRDEASVQRVTKELDPGILPGQRERETLRNLRETRGRGYLTV